MRQGENTLVLSKTPVMSELRMNHSFESVPLNDLVKLICFNEAIETSAVFFGSIKLGLTFLLMNMKKC